MLILKRRFGVTRLRGLAVAAALATSILAMAAALVATWPVAFAAAALVAYACDLYLHRTEPQMMKRLGSWRAGVTVRSVVRLVLLAALVSELSYFGASAAITVTLSVLGFAVAMALYSWLTAFSRRARQLPVTARNLQLPGLRLEPRAPRWLADWPGQRLLHHEAVVWAGVTLSIATRQARWTYLALALSAGLLVLTLLALVPWALRARFRTRRQDVLAKTDAWLQGYRPAAVLYFSGSRESIYQVNMWLSVMESLPERPLVLLRERHLLAQLAPTRLPVLCVPGAVDLMSLDLSTVRVAFYVSNVGKNIHMLRIPTVKHVFIGHGDSDKVASVNPYAKAYDSVWTAGRAGRDRWQAADVGVRDDAIVEVGRPQLDALMADEREPRRVPSLPTVFYAPTWEGWTDEGISSLIVAGENIIRSLLALQPAVRIIYKPHPLTGIRDPRARLAHQAITRHLERANRQASGRAALFGAVDDAPARARHRIELVESERELRRILDSYRLPDADSAQLMAAFPEPPRELLERLTRQRERMTELFWRAHRPWEHVIIQQDSLTLYECFDAADLLISDISSVVSDWIATLKPYALTDVKGLGPEEFRRENTAALGAYVLTPDGRGVRGLADAARFPQSDVLSWQRHRVRDYLLGPSSPASSVRFRRAVTEICAEGGERLVRLQQASSLTTT
ncbi:hypothetical protein [Streptomyces sp. 135]|uniref:hypothetical protein n=1 Tax=Streptomyces sp. 135 TaxID=2838850 RepID=UPI001CBB4A1D|nr:hypothetical protein [Streptomyces sp. 135]